MSHVDKGELHAYLDGALDEFPQAEAERIREHLDGCAECAGELEVERKVRADAEAMLALAVPEVDLPSLEELRAYVKRTRPARQSVSVRMYRMGWAASIALALGTGWMLRGGQLLEAPQLQRGDFESPAGDRAVLPAVERLGASSAESLMREADPFAVDATVPSAIQSADRRVEDGRADVPADVVAKATVPQGVTDASSGAAGPGRMRSGRSVMIESRPKRPKFRRRRRMCWSRRPVRLRRRSRRLPE